ncbi:transposable element Tcb2 transposase [Trichonephila clavipes]|nr:transposable element Tcb2 transposase [Trichonephila clavipes]
MEAMSGQSFIPSNLGHVDDEEVVPAARPSSCKWHTSRDISKDVISTRSLIRDWGFLQKVSNNDFDIGKSTISNSEDHEERGSKDQTIRADVEVPIVPQTISIHLAEENHKSKRPFRALPLTPEHRQLRRHWCQARSMWNVTDWQKVVFSDESRFLLRTDDKRVWVWRRPAYDSRSTLIVMRGTLTDQRYVDDILRPHVGPFPNGLPGAIFQRDNARPHTTRVAQEFLHHFQTFPWHVRSPDLSPVEHVWDQLKRQMQSCHSVHDYELAVQDLWAHLPQDNIRCLIN